MAEEEEKKGEICYHKSSPTPEDKCKLCSGYPVEGCFKYTTAAHVKDFYKQFETKVFPGNLDDLEQAGGFVPIVPRRLEDMDLWQGHPGFGN
jgi:hypothetical protein